MVLLAIDTSGKSGSLTLARVTAGSSALEIVEEVALDGGTFSAQLVPQTMALLQKHGYTRRDLGGFGVVSGPGSFTGLRVGLAAIKAMAEVLSKPIAAVSLLAAVAQSGTEQGRVFSVLDAGRGQLYVGDCEVGPPIRVYSERLLSREEFLTEPKDRIVVTPDLNLAEILRAAGFRVEQVPHPHSSDIARLTWERIQRGETVLPEHLEANYIRRTDAELFSKPRL